MRAPGRLRAFLDVPAGSRADGDMLCQVNPGATFTGLYLSSDVRRAVLRLDWEDEGGKALGQEFMVLGW